MTKAARKRLLSLRQLACLVVALTLAIFAGAILLITRTLRENVRNQIISRDAEILRAVAMMLQAEQAEKMPGEFDEAAQLEVLLKTSRLKGVIAVRLFDAHGKFIASFPTYVRDAKFSENEVAALRQLKPIVYFYSQMKLAELFWPGKTSPNRAENTSPVLEALIPLHSPDHDQLRGIAQFVIDGRNLAAEFAQLDRNLFRQASLIFLAGSFLILGSLSWAFYRLQRANRLLRERSESLLEANQQLALVTRTSAVGLVSAHLLHEMKSQLFGLHTLITAGSEGAMDWKTASEATTRLQSLVTQMIDVIRNDPGSALDYEISLEEFAILVSAEAEPMARIAGVHFEVEVEKPGTIPNHVANLLSIILLTLIENAIQATPRRKTVTLILTSESGSVHCFVQDEGPGIPIEIRKSLFKPVISRKEGGSGVGLALSKQLASHLNATLELKKTGPNGTVFSISLPAAHARSLTEPAGTTLA